MAKRCRFHLRIGWLKGHRLSPKRKDVGIFQRMLVFGIYFHDLDRDLLKIPKKACRIQHSFQEGKGVMSLLATNLSPSRLKTPFPWWIRTLLTWTARPQPFLSRLASMPSRHGGFKQHSVSHELNQEIRTAPTGEAALLPVLPYLLTVDRCWWKNSCVILAIHFFLFSSFPSLFVNL